jgi:ligand-binding sensor domain-containing protein
MAALSFVAPLPALVHAQTPEWTVYTTRNTGMPDNIVRALAVDASGAVWVGTPEGIGRYDGVEWTVLNAENSPLPTSDVWSLTFDAEGALWAAVTGGVVALRDEEWHVFTPDNAPIPDAQPRFVYAEPGGSIWAGFEEGGLSRFDGSSWTVYRSDPHGLPDDDVRDLVVDEEGVVWIATLSGLGRFDGAEWSVIATTSSEYGFAVEVTSVALAVGAVWAGLYEGIFRYGDGVGVTVTAADSGLPSDYVGGVWADPEGVLWISTLPSPHDASRESLAAFDGSEWRVYDSENSGLPEGEIWAVAFGLDGAVWAGTGGPCTKCGLTVFDGANWRIFHSQTTGLPDDAVSAIAFDADGRAWVGVFPWMPGSVALARFDGRVWAPFPEYDPIFGNVRTIATGPGESVWIGTLGWGLFHYDGTVWTSYNPDNSGLPGDRVYALLVEESGALWVGTDRGLAHFDGAEWTVYTDLNSPLPSAAVLSLGMAPDGALWIGGMHDSIARLAAGEWKVYESWTSPLPRGRVWSIAIEDDGMAWFSVNPSGVVRLDGRAPEDPASWTVYDGPALGLLYPNVTQLAFDATGTLWVGTAGQGLLSFDGSAWTRLVPTLPVAPVITTRMPAAVPPTRAPQPRPGPCGSPG